MASPPFLFFLSLFLLFFSLVPFPAPAILVQQHPLVLKYHHGPLLKGNISLNLIWYGHFSTTQRSIIVDFLHSLSSQLRPLPSPSASSWWNITEKYSPSAGRTKTPSITALAVSAQLFFPDYPLGKSLKNYHLRALAAKLTPRSPVSITVVLTSEDVAVEGYCSRCGSHWSSGREGGPTFIWVGNSATQCPGQCAWPFHQPIYGPQVPPLVPPNGDVGVDGMIINLATLLAGTATNPFGNGYFQGTTEAPLEAVTACAGSFGSGSYPGYPGKFLVDLTTGGSYNANGVNGRKFFLPAMWDPQFSACKTLV